jgi:hypothetical protein
MMWRGTTPRRFPAAWFRPLPCAAAAVAARSYRERACCAVPATTSPRAASRSLPAKSKRAAASARILRWRARSLLHPIPRENRTARTNSAARPARPGCKALHAPAKIRERPLFFGEVRDGSTTDARDAPRQRRRINEIAPPSRRQVRRSRKLPVRDDQDVTRSHRRQRRVAR